MEVFVLFSKPKLPDISLPPKKKKKLDEPFLVDFSKYFGEYEIWNTDQLGTKWVTHFVA